MRTVAPPALDLRLAAPAAAAWAGTAWALGATSWQVLAAAVGSILLGVLAALRARRFRPARHRLDTRDGTPTGPDRWRGPVSASVCLVALVTAACLLSTAAHVSARASDPLTHAAAQHHAVTITAMVQAPPHRSNTGGTVLVPLQVRSVGDHASCGTLTGLAGPDWLGLPLGTTIRASVRILPAQSTAQAPVARLSQPQVLAGPQGTLAVVARLRTGLAEATALAGNWPNLASQEAATWGPEGTDALVQGVVLGDDSALPAHVRESFRTVSLTHVTAVSGQHVALVLGLVLACLGILPRRVRAGTGLVVLTALVVLVRPCGSVLRAAAMGGTMLVGVARGRASASLPALCGAIIGILLVDPTQARGWGFALSVVATAGIFLGLGPVGDALARPITRAVRRHLPPGASSRAWEKAEALTRSAASAVALPVVAQAACAPLLIGLQPVVGVWAVPANLAAAPVVGIATVCGLAATLISPWSMGLAVVMVWPARLACAWLILVSEFFNALPLARVPWLAGAGGGLLLAALEAAALTALLYGNRRRVACWPGGIILPFSGTLSVPFYPRRWRSRQGRSACRAGVGPGRARSGRAAARGRGRARRPGRDPPAQPGSPAGCRHGDHHRGGRHLRVPPT